MSQRQQRQFTCLLGCGLLVVVGCSRSNNRSGTADNGSGAIVQPRFSTEGQLPPDEGSAPFTITAVHSAQKPADQPPFYDKGGDWTYVEAHLNSDPAAKFVVGIPALTTKDGPGFGKLMFAPTTSEAGGHVVAQLAKTLRATVPAPTAGGVLQPVKMPIAVLGHNIGKLDNGLGGTGTWDATKLFCSAGHIDSAEMFFNINIAGRRGEFSEKDADYNADVVACLAAILRDGLPPPRAPKNDPTLATTGPQLQIGAKIGSRMQVIAALPDRILLRNERGDSAAVVEVNTKMGVTRDLFTTPDRIDGGKCDATLALCALQLSIPKQGRNSFGNDPSRMMLLESGGATPLQVGTAQASMFAPPAVSPDGRFVVVTEYNPSRLVALDRTTKQVFELAASKGETTWITLVGWAGSSALVERGKGDDSKASTFEEWQLAAKGSTKPRGRYVVPALVSPDGSRSATFEAGVLAVTSSGTTQNLRLHPDDAKLIDPDCCTWLDNRWMTIPNGFIDTDALKVSLLPSDVDAEPPEIKYVRGTRTAIVFERDATYLATVVGP
jgi:hypothetical protein